AHAAAIAEAVAMLHRSRQHVGDRFDPAVRMPRKPGEVVVGVVVAEIVEQQKRIKVVRVTEAKSAAQLDARTFGRRSGLDNTLDWSNGHTLLASPMSPVSSEP